jgi:hypothetical protein
MSAENFRRDETARLNVGYTFDTNYKPGDGVYIDGDKSIRARVTGALWRSIGNVQYEVSWFAGGVLQTAWMTNDRLSLALPA